MCEYNIIDKILKEMGIPDHLTYLLRNLYAGQEAMDREQQTGSKLGKEHIKTAFFGAPKSLLMVSAAMKSKDPSSLEEKL